MSLTEEYTDNFRLTKRGRESNFRTTLSPGSTILMNTAKTQGSVSASSGLTYNSASGESSTKIFPSLSASVRHTFDPRLSLTVTDSFDRNDEPSRGDSAGLRRERRTFISNSFGASVDWLIDLLQTQYYYRNSLFLSDTDTISHIFGLGAATRVGPLDSVRVGYEYSMSDLQAGASSHGNLLTATFSHQLGAYASAGVQGSYSTQSLGELRVWNGSAFATYGLPTGISFSGSLGYSRLSSDTSADQDGISANASASYAHARGVISLGIFQDFRTTYQGGQNFGVVETRGLTGNFSYQLTPFISSFVQASWYQNTNTGVGNVRSNRSQDSVATGAGINWQLLRWLTMSLQYTHNQRTNPGSTENRAVLSLNSSF